MTHINFSPLKGYSTVLIIIPMTYVNQFFRYILTDSPHLDKLRRNAYLIYDYIYMSLQDNVAQNQIRRSSLQGTIKYIGGLVFISIDNLLECHSLQSCSDLFTRKLCLGFYLAFKLQLHIYVYTQFSLLCVFRIGSIEVCKLFLGFVYSSKCGEFVSFNYFLLMNVNWKHNLSRTLF